MKEELIAKAERSIDTSASVVWDALTNPQKIAEYMMGAKVVSEWKEGSDIVWKGEFKGKSYEDKGKIIALIPDKLFTYTHFSPLAGAPDLPENYHTVTVKLKPGVKGTIITLTQDNNSNEKSKEESEKNWGMMLDGLKKVAEEK